MRGRSQGCLGTSSARRLSKRLSRRVSNACASKAGRRAFTPGPHIQSSKEGSLYVHNLPLCQAWRSETYYRSPNSAHAAKLNHVFVAENFDRQRCSAPDLIGGKMAHNPILLDWT